MTSDSDPKYYVLTRRSSTPGRQPNQLYFSKRTSQSTGHWTAHLGAATLFTEEQARSWSLFQETETTRMEPWENPCPLGHDVLINDLRESHVERHAEGHFIELTVCLVCDRCGAKMIHEINGEVDDDDWKNEIDRTVDVNQFPKIDSNDKEQS